MMDHLHGPRHQAFPHRVSVFVETCSVSDTRGLSRPHARLRVHYSGLEGRKAGPITMWDHLLEVRNKCEETAQ
jgi:hypothetical protein